MAGIEENSSPSTSTSIRRSGNKRSSSARHHSTSTSQHHHHQHHHQHHSLRKQTSASSIRNVWKLKYQDFIIQNGKDERSSRSDARNSSSFQKLMTKANDWLQANTNVQVRTCEVVTWMSSDSTKLGNCETMMVSKQLREGVTTYYVRGLRLWLVPQQATKAQTICFEDIVPEDGERIQDLVEKTNSKIEKRQLRGHILSVQTIGAPIRDGKIENKATSWSDEADFDSHYIFFLRVFYLAETNIQTDSIKGQTLIGIKDLLPEPTDEGYEAFEVLLDKTNAWLRGQAEVVSIANMQSVIIQKQEGSSGVGEVVSDTCRYVMPGVNSTEPFEFFRILRVVYGRRRKSSSSSTPSSDCLPILPIAYETITPQLISTATDPGSSGQMEKLETMKETFSKVVAFLRNSGAEVICAETVINPMQLYSDELGQTPGQRSEDEIQFLFTIRLYLSCQSRNGFNRPSIRRVTSNTQLTSTGQSDDEIGGQGQGVNKGGRSSPLFLRSVVTRQFKYRWLVLAVSAFSCMAIIVVVSVVYSNQ